MVEVSPDAFRDIVARAGEAMNPAVVRGLASDLPVVIEGSKGEMALFAYLGELGRAAAVSMIHAPASVHGKFGYGADFQTFNFSRSMINFRDFVEKLASGHFGNDAVAVQSVPSQELGPRFAEENAIPGMPAGGDYRLWIGTASEVSAHCDPEPNVAYVALGRRRFSLFAPEEMGNLYLGPFNPTPSGTQVSLVDPLEPDNQRFPRFAAAWDRAVTADLSPGDAIFIPAGWYHHVQALAPANLLVNYWWPVRPPASSPWDVLLHGFMALRDLPAADKRLWQARFAHYIFEQDGDAAAHLPIEAQGIMAQPTPGMKEAMRQQLLRALAAQ